MEGLEKEGYDTWCVGGVAFFDKRSDLGKVFPSYFQKSYWNPSFSCPVKDSTKKPSGFYLEKSIEGRSRPAYFSVSECGCNPLSELFLSRGCSWGQCSESCGGASLCRWRAGKIVYRVEKVAGQYICDLLFGSWHLLWRGWLPVSRCQPSSCQYHSL